LVISGTKKHLATGHPLVAKVAKQPVNFLVTVKKPTHRRKQAEGGAPGPFETSDTSESSNTSPKVAKVAKHL
jgi:hypothetical protein